MNTAPSTSAVGSGSRLDTAIENPDVGDGGKSLRTIELEVLESMANAARLEATMRQACVGSVTAQKAACLEWLAADAAYADVVADPKGRMLPSTRCLAAQGEMARQFWQLVHQYRPDPD